jgi:hypothetical protein
MKSEVFDRQGQGPASPAQPTFGWDPYEVWRTRVKAAPEEAMLLSSGSVVGDSREVSTLVLSRMPVSSETSERVEGSFEGSRYIVSPQLGKRQLTISLRGRPDHAEAAPG